MKSYVVNLAGATERLRHIRETFGRIGIEFERFDAIDRERAASHPEAARLPPFKERQWLPSEVGCLLSHFEIWRLVAKGEEPYAAVFEDDVIVDDCLASVLSAEAAIPPDADVVKLETTLQPVYLGRPITIEQAPGVGIRRAFSQHRGSGAYIISRRAAQRLASLIDRFDGPIDLVLFSPWHEVGRTLRTYQVDPALAIQDQLRPAEEQTGHLSSTIRADRVAASGDFRPRGNLLTRALRKSEIRYRLGPGRKTVVEFGVGLPHPE